jgi:hydrogenase maturation protease
VKMPVWIVGVGNVFLGDDGFGVAVVDALRHRPLPAGVCALDFGIRTTHLAFALLDPPALLLVADAASQGGEPGSLYLIDPDLDDEMGISDAHGMDLGTVFATVRALGGRLPPVRIVGCEPLDITEHMGLSNEVERAVGPASELLVALARAELSSMTSREAQS